MGHNYEEVYKLLTSYAIDNLPVFLKPEVNPEICQWQELRIKIARL